MILCRKLSFVYGLTRQVSTLSSLFKSYLFTISYHLVIKELRRQLQNPLMQEYVAYTSQLYTSGDKAAEGVEFDQFEKALRQAKDKLTPRQREIFELNKELNVPCERLQKSCRLRSRSCVTNYRRH